MDKVTSKDGTTIVFDRLGQGPAVVLVCGASGVRSHPIMADLARQLAPHFTVFNYDRRGRGDSSDTRPYAVEREVEDIEALIDAGGGSACIYGLSSGAVLALEAASRLPAKIKKAALFEPPFIVDGSRPPIPNDYVQHLTELSAAGRRGEAAEYFLTAAMGLPAEYLAAMKSGPMWAELEGVAHTLAYDGAIMGDTMSGRPLRTARWASATAPTLVMTGGLSPEFFHTGAKALVAGLPRAEHRVLEGQSHGVAAEALAPVLAEFFSGFTITRVFDAPRELVFKAWTEPARFAQWFGLRDSTIPLESVAMDVRPGGGWRATMIAGPERMEIQWKGAYREVVPPERLVFTLSDQPGDEAEVVTVSLTDLGGKTEMVFQQRGGHLTEEGYARAAEGWSAFFERLAEHVAQG